MIDLHKLHVFDTVVQTSRFSTAAERLYITQSAVSQHIKELEASLGQQLFVRGRRGVVLTAQGELLAEYSQKVFALISQAETVLTDVNRLASGKISIGATPGVGIYLLPDWVQRFRTKYPQFTVALQTGVTSQIVNDVMAHRLDIGIVEGDLDGQHPDKINSQILEEVEQLVVIGFRHPFWNKEQINLADLNQQSFIMRQQGSQSRAWLEHTLSANGVTPIIGAEFDNLESIKRTVSAGPCLTILPSYVVESEFEQHQLQLLHVAGKPLVRQLKLIWAARTSFSPVTRAFLNELTSGYATLHTVLDR